MGAPARVVILVEMNLVSLRCLTIDKGREACRAQTEEPRLPEGGCST